VASLAALPAGIAFLGEDIEAAGAGAASIVAAAAATSRQT
jgi:hypothetical protein